jgi:hypothetical protein
MESATNVNPRMVAAVLLISPPCSPVQHPREKTIHRRSGAARKNCASQDEETEMATGESGWANSEE